MHKKKGDTLVEVALAIGIFSLVAIVVVSVISASTSTAQASLELTVTREELDSQAEALRFIHDSFVIGSQSKDAADNPYTSLWNAIASHAIDESTANVGYNPRTCSELYETNGRMKTSLKQFVINTRKLSEPSDIDNIIITTTPTSSRGPFYEASTYPRILYGDSVLGSTSTSEDFYGQVENTYKRVQRIEGIYIIAVKGKDPIVSQSGGVVSSKVAYYEFYIRSCWMPPGSDYASTVSTVVRLYDPAVITY